jgi:lytic cellulose monooxygenase (C1-hydroxylating)
MLNGQKSDYCHTAGDQVTVEMHQQPGDRSCANEAIGGDHYGPMQVYLAKVDDATSAVGSDASWFKIAEMGMPSDSPDYWATEVLNVSWRIVKTRRRDSTEASSLQANCGHYTVTIPTGIAPGNYLLKAEVIGETSEHDAPIVADLVQFC